MPTQFWWSEHMIAALSTWHFGRVIDAYRTHPFRGPQPLSQKRVAAWLDLTQAQLSRIETGPAPETMTKLMRWAQILRAPAELLWFELSSVLAPDAASRKGCSAARVLTAIYPLVQQAGLGRRPACGGIAEPANREPGTCDEPAWFALDALPARMIPYCREALRHLAAGRRFSSYGGERLGVRALAADGTVIGVPDAGRGGE